ncbi:hypothetical protein HT031_006572 [Scenedesmus sp. PABB004]|nr:hypothetical protein HT031_006572 [Scenedesmus sp. PABB004]
MANHVRSEVLSLSTPLPSVDWMGVAPAHAAHGHGGAMLAPRVGGIGARPDTAGAGQPGQQQPGGGLPQELLAMLEQLEALALAQQQHGELAGGPGGRAPFPPPDVVPDVESDIDHEINTLLRMKAELNELKARNTPPPALSLALPLPATPHTSFTTQQRSCFAPNGTFTPNGPLATMGQQQSGLHSPQLAWPGGALSPAAALGTRGGSTSIDLGALQHQQQQQLIGSMSCMSQSVPMAVPLSGCDLGGLEPAPAQPMYLHSLLYAPAPAGGAPAQPLGGGGFGQPAAARGRFGHADGAGAGAGGGGDVWARTADHAAALAAAQAAAHAAAEAAAVDCYLLALQAAPRGHSPFARQASPGAAAAQGWGELGAPALAPPSRHSISNDGFNGHVGGYGAARLRGTPGPAEDDRGMRRASIDVGAASRAWLPAPPPGGPSGRPSVAMLSAPLPPTLPMAPPAMAAAPPVLLTRGSGATSSGGSAGGSPRAAPGDAGGAGVSAAQAAPRWAVAGAWHPLAEVVKSGQLCNSRGTGVFIPARSVKRSSSPDAARPDRA